MSTQISSQGSLFTRRLLRAAALGLVVAGPALPARAQDGVPQRVAAIKSGLAQSAAALRGYTWLETTQMAMKGEVKSTTNSTCLYPAATGPAKCTPIDPAEPKEGKGVLRKKIVANKVEELKDYMDSVKTLVAKYVPPQPELIQSAQGRGDVAVAPNPSTGTVKVTVSNYLQKGDAVVFNVNSTTSRILGIEITTWLNDPKAGVSLSVQYATLPNGVSYISQKVLTAAAKEIVVTISSANYAVPITK
jgi:hypothetical protein